MDKAIQRRAFQVTELRADPDKRTITGHAAVFNHLSEELWGFREKIAPGAFSKTIQEADVRALFNHDPNFVLGRNKAGTLTMSEDKRGLAVEIQPPDTEWARDLMASMRRGDIDQMSFGFLPVKDRWEEDRAAETVTRTLLEVRLFDVSVVTYPAYTQTDASVRSVIDFDLLALTKILVRATHGLTVSDEDRVMLKASIDNLTRYLPEPVTHSEPAVEPLNSALKMRLDLARVA